MPEFPQIVRQRLKVSPSPGIHPDADVLTAFGERSLPEAERAVVVDHLARCGDCREVIALALPASEAADVTSARTVQRGGFSWPVLRWGLVAAGIVAAVLVGVEQVQRHQRANVTVAQVQVMTRGQENYAPAPTQTPESPPVAPQAPPRSPIKSDSNKSDKDQTMPLQGGRAVRTDSAAASAVVASGAAFGAGLRPKSKMAVVEPPPDLASARDTKKPMPPAIAKSAPAPSGEVLPSVSETVDVQSQVQSQANENAAQSGSLAQEQQQQSRNAGEPRVFEEGADVVARAKSPVVPSDVPVAAPASMSRWIISSTGSLQRSLDGGSTWQEVDVAAEAGTVANSTTVDSLANPQAHQNAQEAARKEEKGRTQTVAWPVFRAVAAMGLEVWAGGSASILYHSIDGGEHWARVLPAVAGVALKGDITRIQFPDAQHGVVSTSSSEVWTTSDGGQSWRKQ